MRTIAISIDNDLLSRIDGLVASDPETYPSRSSFFRSASRDYLHQAMMRREEEREQRIFAKSRWDLEKEAEALVREQAGL